MPKANTGLMELAQVSREVFNTTNVRAKTELTPSQIHAANVGGTIGFLFNQGIIESHIVDFMTLQKSLNRASMGELTQMGANAVTKMKETIKEKSLL